MRNARPLRQCGDDQPGATAAARTGEVAAIILIAILAMVVPVTQAIEGVKLVGLHSGDDASFAVGALDAYTKASGTLLPGWSVAGNGGSGTPLFLYYAPGAYIVAAALGRILPSAPEASLIGVACILFQAGAILTCTAWLRRHVPPAPALLGGALYVLMPYLAAFDPQMRLDFAEIAANAMLPLMFIAIDAGRGRVAHTAFWVAPVLAAILFVHVTSAVLGGGLATLYAIAQAGSVKRGAEALAGSIAGILLGLGLAGATLIPALVLLPDINAQLLQLPFLLPERNFLLQPHDALLSRGGVWLLNAGLVLPLGLAAFGLRATWSHALWGRAVLVTLAAAVLLTLPLSAPLWATLPPLRDVQFPWRLLTAVSLFGAASASTGFASAVPLARRSLMLAAVGLGLAWTGFAIQRGDHGRPDRQRTVEALASSQNNTQEYFPKTAGPAWNAARLQGTAALTQLRDSLSGCPSHHGLQGAPSAGGLRVQVGPCAGSVLLPQFYFPGWRAHGSAMQPMLDPATGLVSVTVAPGTREVTLTRFRTPVESAGLAVTAVAVLAWLALAYGAVRGSRRPNP